MRTLILLPVLLTACAPRSAYSPPPLPVSAAWPGLEAASTAGRTGEGRWWEEFSDAGLVTLVEDVLAANGNLAAAGYRLERAQLANRLAGRALLPSASASLDSGARTELDGPGESRGSGASLGVSWEVDLSGRLAAERDAASWEAAAMGEDLLATRLGLIGAAVTAWYQLAHANERVTLADESLGYTRRALQLVQLQYQAGAVSRVELRDAEQSVATQEAARTQLVQAQVESRNALAALLARQGYDGPELPRLPREGLPAVDPGLPAEILARRPDLAAAEYRLRASLASADATRAGFYPTLNLTAGLGAASDSLLDFVGNPVASLGALLSLPFLNPERVRLAVGIARADYAASSALFRQTFFDAVTEVSSLLSQRARQADQARALARSLDAARDAEMLYERQYRAGAIPLRNWLDAQERRRNAEIAVTDNRLARIVNQVTLHQALGGDARTPA